MTGRWLLLLLVMCAVQACAASGVASTGEATPQPTAVAYPAITALDPAGARSFSPATGEAGTIRYHLSSPAAVRIRIVDAATPGILLRTLIDWEPRAAGWQAERWDGVDAKGRLLDPHAVSFVVAAEPLREGLDPAAAEKLAALRHPEIKHFRHPRENCSDLTVRLLSPRADETLRGEATIAAAIVGQPGLPQGAYHVMVYLDGRTAWDGRVESTQFALTFDTRNVSDGEHELAVTFNDLQDHAGSDRLRVYVAND